MRGPATKRNPWLAAGIFLGIILLFSPVAGLVMTAVNMAKGFTTASQDGLSSGVRGLAEQTGEALVATVVGLIFAVPGLALLITCVVLRSRESKRLQEAASRDATESSIGN